MRALQNPKMTELPLPQIFMAFCFIFGNVHFIGSNYVLAAFCSLQGIMPHIYLCHYCLAGL